MLFEPNEDYNLEDSLSESSENSSEEVQGEAGSKGEFDEGVCAIKPSSWQKVTAVCEEKIYQLMVLVLF